MTFFRNVSWPCFGDFLREQAPLVGKRVLVRVDFNVPMSAGKPADVSRLRACAPTVKKLTESGAIVILVSHLGNPKHSDESYSLRRVVSSLEEILGRTVFFGRSDGLEPGEVSLLENTRFQEGEVENDPAVAKGLADLADVFIFDAFSVAHRSHASTCGVMRYLPTYFGLSFEREWKGLQALELNRPVVAVVGGAKVSTKLAALCHLVGTVDCVAVVGGMANTFLNAEGYPIGHSLFEPAMLDSARDVVARAQERGCRLMLPHDVIVERAGGRFHIQVDQVQEADMVLDVGPDTLEDIFSSLSGAKTLVWNGPLGAFEMPGFEHGTIEFARRVADLTVESRIYSIVGGGDTVHAIERDGLTDSFSHVSTAGGAFLTYLAGQDLPVFEPFRDAR